MSDGLPARSRDRVSAPGGQLLVAVYAVFAVAAGARSAVQIATRFGDAPAAYLLSALAAVVYLVATVALRYRGSRAWSIAVAACSIELAGVLVVGAISVLVPSWFPDQTVWSDFGAGYGFVPLLLPALGLAWLLRQR